MIAMHLQAFMDESRRRGLVPHAYLVPDDNADDILQGHALRSPGKERCVVVWNGGNVLNHLREAGYRAVSLEAPSPGYDGLMVATDARMAAQVGVDYLRSLGHEKITLLVNEPDFIESVQDKIEQFRAALPGGEVVVCAQGVAEGAYNTAYAHMHLVWELRPTAIMTVSDPGAWAALHWLAEQGISVPGEVSVLGFEDVPSSQFQRPALSTIAHPVETLAKTALDMLWSEDDTTRRRLVPPHLVIRGSTGPCP
jgi:LacI family transcriptional regulator